MSMQEMVESSDSAQLTPKRRRRAGVRWKLRLAVYSTLLGGIATYVWACTSMPGASATRAQAATSHDQLVAGVLKKDVEYLATHVPRNLEDPQMLQTVQTFLERRLQEASGRAVQSENVESKSGQSANFFIEFPGVERPEQIWIVGAHYDSAHDTPGANDNASGVAASLALAQAFRGRAAKETLRFVLFANEEPPYFKTSEMGSWVHARGCKTRGEQVRGMFSLETMGYYSDDENSQRYPSPLDLAYPSTGNFIAFVGNLDSRALVRSSLGAFRSAAQFPSEGGAFPSYLPGIGWSDHWAFWQHGFPAIMITDTAPFRDPHYHQSTDTPEHLDYEKMSVVVSGLERMLRALTAAG